MAEQKQCPNCGELLAPETPFCTRCGADQSHSGPQYATHANSGFSQPGPVALPKNWMIESILSTICCCLPVGIVAIVFASRVDKLAYQGNLAGAHEAAGKAKMFTIIAVVLGIVSNIVVSAVLLPVFEEAKEKAKETAREEALRKQPAMPELTVPEMYIVPK